MNLYYSHSLGKETQRDPWNGGLETYHMPKMYTLLPQNQMAL